MGVIGRASNEESMAEVPNAGEDHCDSELVGGSDDVFILYGPAGLNHGSCARGRHGFKAVGEGKESIGGGDGALERQHSLLRAEARGIDAAHLTGAHSHGLAIACIDDGVRLDVLADTPGEDQAAQFFGGGRTPGNDLQFVLGDAACVGVLQKQAAGNLLDDRARRCGTDFDKTQILFRGEAFARLRTESWSCDGFDEELGNLSGGFAIHGAIDPDDAAESGDRVACERFLICLENGLASGGTAGVGVFDDDCGGLVELLCQFPTCVEVDEVVKAQFLTLELGRACDAQARAVGVESSTLMRVFAITQTIGPGGS